MGSHLPKKHITSQTPAGASGFTLVEVLVAMGVFAIGLMVLTMVFSQIQMSQQNAMYQRAAASAAHSQIETLKTTEFAEIVDGMAFTSTLPTALPAGSTGTIAVSAADNALDAKKVSVIVSYPIGSTTKNIKLTTYIESAEDSR